MGIKTVFFDLDGTLLPMDQDEFTEGYFSLLVKKLARHGYEPDHLVKSVWDSVLAMVKNNGTINNENAFWKQFSSIYGEKGLADKPLFDEFYVREFRDAKRFCGFTEAAAKAVCEIKNMGCKVVLTTNPIFPAVATESRIKWAGLNKSDFELYTTYENCCYCKPNPEYYIDILKRLNLKAEECLMVGNDATEDMVAETVGLQVFLLTDCLVNKKQKDISVYPQGGFKQMMEYVKDNV